MTPKEFEEIRNLIKDNMMQVRLVLFEGAALTPTTRSYESEIVMYRSSSLAIKRIPNFAIAAMLAAVMPSIVIAESQLVVHPPELENTEGPTVYGTRPEPRQSTRHQWLFPASTFPTGTQSISAISFRPDRSAPEREVNFGNVRVQLTPRIPSPLSTTFRDNIRDELITVFDSSLTFSNAAPIENQPQDFVYTIPFAEPFSYSPVDGRDLLVDFTTSDGLNHSVRWDAHSGPVAVVATDSTSAFGFTLDFQPVMQFSVDVVAGSIVGDFDEDGLLTASDIDLLSLAIGPNDLKFDLSNDGIVNDADRELWVTDIKQTSFGDADLDGAVQFNDFLALSAGFGMKGGWANGDFDGSGDVQFPDFLILAQNFSSSSQSAVVPEPLGALPLLLAAAGAISTLGRVRRVSPK